MSDLFNETKKWWLIRLQDINIRVGVGEKTVAKIYFKVPEGLVI